MSVSVLKKHGIDLSKLSPEEANNIYDEILNHKRINLLGFKSADVAFQRADEEWVNMELHDDDQPEDEPSIVAGASLSIPGAYGIIARLALALDDTDLWTVAANKAIEKL